jgi:hypothetical protein
MPRHKLIFKVNGLVVFHTHHGCILNCFSFSLIIPRDIFLPASVAVGDAHLIMRPASPALVNTHLVFVLQSRGFHSARAGTSFLTCKSPAADENNPAESNNMYDTGAVWRTHKWSRVLLALPNSKPISALWCADVFYCCCRTSSFAIERRDFFSVSCQE